EQVLEAGSEVDLDRLDLAEAVEVLVRQRRGAVLYRAADAVLAPRDLPEPAMDVEVDRYLGDCPIGVDGATVGSPGLDAHLRDRDPVRAARSRLGELALQAVQERPQLGLAGVLLADLADLAADADRDPVRLERSDERCQLRG